MATENLDIIVNAVDNASQVLRGLGATIGTISSLAGATLSAEDVVAWDAIGASITFAVQAMAAVVSLGAEGSQLTRQVERSAQVYASMGGSATAFYDAVIRGSKGTVDSYQIMESTNRGIYAGLFQNTRQAEDFASVIKMLSDTYGADFIKEFDTAVKAAATGRQFRLANLGINYDPKVGAEYYKNLMNINRELTIAEQKQAGLTYIVDEYQQMVDSAGRHTLTNADAIERTGARYAKYWADATRFAGEFVGDAAAKMEMHRLEGEVLDDLIYKRKLSAKEANAEFSKMQDDDVLKRLANYEEYLRRVNGTVDSAVENEFALREQREADLLAMAELNELTDQAVAKNLEMSRTERIRTQDLRFEVATSRDLIKARENLDDAITELLQPKNKKNRAGMYNEAWGEWEESATGTLLNLAKAGGVSTKVLTDVATQMNYTDKVSLAAFDAFKQLSQLGTTYQEKGTKGIMDAVIFGGSDPETTVKNINDIVERTLLFGTHNFNPISPTDSTPFSSGTVDLAGNIVYGINESQVQTAVSTAEAMVGDIHRNLIYTLIMPGGKRAPTENDQGNWHAAGGYEFAGKSYLVGERGPELFTPGQSGYITPNDRLTSASGGGTFSFYNKVTFVVQGGEVNMSKLIKQLRSL